MKYFLGFFLNSIIELDFFFLGGQDQNDNKNVLLFIEAWLLLDNKLTYYMYVIHSLS